MSGNSDLPKGIDQNGISSSKSEVFDAAATEMNDEAHISQGNFSSENSEKTTVIISDAKNDLTSDPKDKSRKNRSRSRSRHYRDSPSKGRRDRRRSRSRSRDYRTRRSRSRKRSGSRSKDRRRKSRSPERKRYRSRSTDKKPEKKNGGRDSKSTSPGRVSNFRPHDDDAGRRRKRSRSRERGHRYKRSPDVKHGNDIDKGHDESSRYSYRRQNDNRYADVKSPRENYRRNETRQSNNTGWQRDANQNSWNERHPSNASEDALSKSIASIRKEFENKDTSHFPNENSSNASIPVLLSSNCKVSDPTFPMANQTPDNNFGKSVAPPGEGRLPAPPRMAVPPTSFKDGMPNVREPPPAFLPFRPNNPVTVRLQAEPPSQTFTLLNHTRLSMRNVEPQQVLLQPVQVIRGPAKMEIPVDLRFLNPELRLPLYSTGIINRPMAPSQQVTNFIGGVPMDQTRMVHQVQSRLVGVPQVSDVPPPPPPPQTFTIAQPQAIAPNAPFGTSGVPRLPENVSFITNPPPQLIFSSLGNRPGFITNLPMNESLQPRVPASHPPPPQIIIQDFQPQISSSMTASSNLPTSLPAHSTADVHSKTLYASRINKSKPKNTGSEKYSPYSCSSEGSSNDAYSDTLFEDPFNDTGTPLEEENSTTHDGFKSHDHSVTSISQGMQLDQSKAPLPMTSDSNSQSSSEIKSDALHSFVGLPGIAKNIDLSSTLNLIHVNDLKKVLETANSVTKVKQNETSEVKSSKAQRMEQIAEEVKVALKPHFSKSVISKEEYKDIMRKAVPKIFTSRSSPDANRIQAFVQEYVNKIVKSRKSGKIKNTTAHGASHDKKQSSKIPAKA